MDAAPLMTLSSSAIMTIQGQEPSTAADPPMIRLPIKDGGTTGTPHGTAACHEMWYIVTAIHVTHNLINVYKDSLDVLTVLRIHKCPLVNILYN